jgi:membrane peptidoglycan carboxypeptidase
VVQGSLIVAIVGAAVGCSWYKDEVIDNPGDHIQPEAIQAVIAQESPVLYRDGKTRIGVFFDKDHREYVPFEQIPEAWVQAIVAAEDKSFWSHPGVDFAGIARAMKQNIAAGKLVAGGSSLTQQTAKNLFYRPDRSLKSKWTELVNALRLEAHYSKEDILEFYANQFHVNSNGRGLGIAARYFFDKRPEEMDTLECAFIAGMVKAPSRYNPFIGSEERKERSLQRARDRTDYVLRRMHDEGHLSAEQLKSMQGTDIPFKRGRFQYQKSSIVDEVAIRLTQAPFPRVFHELGIDNPSTAGISIITTLDADAQRAANYGLWHHLTEVGPLLEKQTAAALLLPEAKAPAPGAGRSPAVRGFYIGRVMRADANEVTVDLAGSRCRIDKAGLDRMARILAQARSGNRWARATPADLANLRATLAIGSVVRVSIREAGDPAPCDLELRTELQGAVMLLEHGQIRAMVGGNENKDYNRAVTAKRQLGSTWKPLLYLAALQLGWAPTDPLDNRPNAFHFSGGWYYPRSGHKGEPWTSISWAGTRSENLASIWLMAHLTDRLSPSEFRKLAKDVGLAQGADESRKAFIQRMQGAGVNGADSRLDEMVFIAAKQDVLSRTGHSPEGARELQSMSFGFGLDKELARVRGRSGARQNRKTKALRRTFQHLQPLSERCAAQGAVLRILVGAGRAAAAARQMAGWEDVAPDPLDLPALPDPSELSSLRVRRGATGLELACGEVSGDWFPVDAALLSSVAHGRTQLAGGLPKMVVVDGLPSEVLDDLNETMPRMRGLLSVTSPYDLERLQYHPDFRALLGMRYLDRLARALGVQSRLPSVLSLPLGSVDISLEEAASMYQGMMDLQAWTFPGEIGGPAQIAVSSPSHPAQLILEIRDRYGQVLYSAEPVPRPVADANSGRLVGDILRNVVRWGTGRRALGKVRIGETAVPVAGKTGTTNSYRNAAFAGYVPKVGPDGWVWGNAYTLVIYVGYDDNRMMQRGNVRLQGSDGALPAWISTAQGLADAGLLGEVPAGIGTEFIGGPGEWATPVVSGSGLQVSTWDVAEGESARTVLIHTDRSGINPKRSFTPVQP